jgi:cyclic-di-GMP-binding protein
MPSFDVVSELDWSEVQNALAQTQKELSQRFDFKGTKASVEKTDAGIVVRASEDDRAKAALDVLREKLVRRKVSLKHFDAQKPEKGPQGSSKILVKVKEGIDKDDAKALVSRVKESKLKVQAAIQADCVRVTGKKRDDLQEVIQMLKAAELDIELQFKNFRE